ncbi:restriction endonuclease subunit S [Blautia coccoides]|uniref:restriction endonuclease subunit S n=1 Tax=Blautia producta TaxID=33035 RepID=UPI0028A38659|nr:restriction endonuclease subunit S [Blautia coccoides]MDT4376953.1 restriction endonuclease subunit S [Blautia coccoides]
MKFNESSLYNIQSSVLGERRSLYELANWKNGIAFKKINFSDTGVPVIKIAELNNGIGGTTAYTQQIFSEDVHLKRGDLLFSWSGNPQTSIDIFRFKLEEGWLNQHIFKITPYEEIVDRDFFYFLMKNLKPYFTQIAINKQTTGLGHVTIADIKKISIVIPSLDLQREIVSYIKPIDDKIELNNEINNNLEQQAIAMYKNRFINIEQDNGNLPQSWKKGTVSDVIEIHDSKRIPLSSRERAELDKIYPYYGATSIMDYVDKYLFDGIYLLLGEDGTVIDDNGHPILQYVEGKFWVNNHAHILTGKNGFSVEMLYLLFKLTNVKSIVTGAVQLKISQANLKSIPIIIPSTEELETVNQIIQPIFAQIRNLRSENESLSTLRDSLLPKLMSGELDVSEIDL